MKRLLSVDIGRLFLVSLVNLEARLRDQIISLENTKILNQLKNWQYVVAFMTSKLSAYQEGETDFSSEIENPIFTLVRQNTKRESSL